MFVPNCLFLVWKLTDYEVHKGTILVFETFLYKIKSYSRQLYLKPKEEEEEEKSNS